VDLDLGTKIAIKNENLGGFYDVNKMYLFKFKSVSDKMPDLAL